MVKSFLNGIDPIFEEYVRSAVERAILESSSLIITSIITDFAEQERLKSALEAELKNIAEGVNGGLSNYISKYSSKPIRDMIRSMPKQELASLASSLIEITSLKRKVTREQETVGGPVDVAIISKAEGFVWVKRKHYFPPELNRRFFVRHFGEGGFDGNSTTA